MAATFGQAALSRVKCLWRPSLLNVRGVTIVPAFAKSTSRSPPDSLSNVEMGVTSDGKTLVFYHPYVEFPYELSQPIPRPDPSTAPPETHEQVLKDRLGAQSLKGAYEASTIEELRKMFYTTKHRWYPIGQYRRRRIKKDTPKDR